MAAKVLMHNIAKAMCQRAQETLTPHIAEHYRVHHADVLRHLPRVVVA